jgi:hypothetical protein
MFVTGHPHCCPVCWLVTISIVSPPHKTQMKIEMKLIRETLAIYFDFFFLTNRPILSGDMLRFDGPILYRNGFILCVGGGFRDHDGSLQVTAYLFQRPLNFFFIHTP